MTWSNLLANGVGSVRFAIVIEGWPDIWVTDASLTLASWSSLQSRNVRVGLLRDGLEFRERLIPQDAIPEVDGMTFRIRSSNDADEAMVSFTTAANHLTGLSADITNTATSMSVHASTVLSTSGYYHIGTEVIQAGPSAVGTDIVRGRWNTTGQAHKINYFDGQQSALFYDRPPTMDGRRVTLYGFGTGDDGADLDNGTVIYRGTVAVPPRLDTGDNITWSIQTDSIVGLLKQDVVGHEVEARLTGLYHHRGAPFVVRVIHNGSHDVSYHEGLDKTLEDFFTAINTLLDAANTAVSAPSGLLTRISMTTTGVIRVTVYTAGTAPTNFYQVFVGSPLMGWNDSEHWIDDSGQSVWANTLSTNTSYTSDLSAATPPGMSNLPVFDDGPTSPSSALGYTNMFEALNEFPGFQSVSDADLSLPENRIYVDRDMSTIASTGAVYIDGIDYQEPILVSGSGQEGNVWYLEVVLPRQHNGRNIDLFFGFLSDETVVRPVFNYGDDDSLENFVSNVVSVAEDEGNDGIAPFITYEDFPESGGEVDWTVEGTHNEKVRVRRFSFYEATPLYDVIQAELQLLGHIMYLGSDAKMHIRQLPLFSATSTTDKTIDTGDIITPADDYGSWPGWTLQEAGLVNSMTLFDGYQVREDEWDVEMVFRQHDSVSHHKNRGRGGMEIAPRSRSTVGNLDAEEGSEIVGRYFSFLARDYALITVEVPYTKLSYLCGDIVKLTCPHVPAGDGTRGVTNLRAAVIDRRWNFDPARREMGQFKLLVFVTPPSGYTPSAAVDDETDNGSDNWTLSCLSTNNLNIAMSTAGDGKVLQNFTAGDKVRIIQRDTTTSATDTLGTVASVDTANDTITIDFDSTYTPGTNPGDDVLIFQQDVGSHQAAQLEYAFVSGTDTLNQAGAAGELFS